MDERTRNFRAELFGAETLCNVTAHQPLQKHKFLFAKRVLANTPVRN
jgi:hypothetical protein